MHGHKHEITFYILPRRITRWISYAAIGVVAFLMGSTTRQPPAAPVASAGVEDSLSTRVTGIGGVFFKSRDPASIRKWYRDHLGISSEDWGGFSFRWREQDRPDEIGYTVWGVFPDTTDYFAPAQQPYMLNYRVVDLAELVTALREEGVDIAGKIEEYPNGKFAWILDPEGRKIELWEPVPSSDDPYLE